MTRVTPAMMQAGALAFRNSSWHELCPTVVDVQVSDECFGEVFEAMEAKRERGADEPEIVAWLRDAHEGEGDECLVPAADDVPPLNRFTPQNTQQEEALRHLRGAVTTADQSGADEVIVDTEDLRFLLSLVSA